MTSDVLKEEIRISVLIPVYNVENYLKECLESVIRQSKPVYEVILVDDGSTDNSGVIGDEYSRKYDYIKSYHKENQGQLSARQYGISKATGNWYVFLDADDMLKEYTIETLYKNIDTYYPDCVIYGLDRIHDMKIIGGFEPEINKKKLILDKSEFYELVFTHSALNSLCRKAVRAELLSRDYSQYYNISLAEDLLQSIEIYEKGQSFLYLPVSLYNYRYNESSITNTVNIQSYKVDFTVRETVITFLKKENVFSAQQWEAYNKYSLKVFLDQVKTILTFNASSYEIKRLLNDVRQSKYFKEYIDKVDKASISLIGSIIISELHTGHYSMMIGINKIYNVKKKIL